MREIMSLQYGVLMHSRLPRAREAFSYRRDALHRQ
jgi:hypothetical protein